MCGVRLNEHGADETTVVHEVYARPTVPKQILKSTTISTEPETVLSHSFDNTGHNKAICAAIGWALLSIELYESGTERHARKVVELLHYDKFDIEKHSG